MKVKSVDSGEGERKVLNNEQYMSSFSFSFTASSIVLCHMLSTHMPDPSFSFSPPLLVSLSVKYSEQYIKLMSRKDFIMARFSCFLFSCTAIE